MSTSDDIHNTTATANARSIRAVTTRAQVGAQPRATGGQINSVLTC